MWRADLALGPPALEALAAILSAAELQRAAAFGSTSGRDAFVARRGVLRRLLSAYTGTDPAGLELDEGAHGKPFLIGHPALSFNLAHSGGVALYGVTAGADIGIDVERLRDRIDHMGVARRFFSTNEYAALEALPATRRLASFFSCWAAKEAFVKATGAGLSHGLRGFQVPVPPPPTPSPVAGRWWLSALSVDDGYAAAVVVDGFVDTVTVRRW